MKYSPSKRIRVMPHPTETPPESVTAVGENAAVRSRVSSSLATECEATPAIEIIETIAAKPIATFNQDRQQAA